MTSVKIVLKASQFFSNFEMSFPSVEEFFEFFLKKIQSTFQIRTSSFRISSFSSKSWTRKKLSENNNRRQIPQKNQAQNSSFEK